MIGLSDPLPTPAEARDDRRASAPASSSARAWSWSLVALPVAGALASWLAWRFLPLPTTDPLRGTLAAVPGVVAAFAAFDLAARRRGALRLGPEWLRLELGALALLVAAGLARTVLGLGATTPALGAGFVGLAAVHAALQVRALRPLLDAPGRVGSRLRAPSVLFLVLPALLYVAALPWAAERRQPDGDEPYYLLVAHSLAYDLDADLANQYRDGDWRFFLDRPIAPQPGDPRGAEGEVYSRHNVLLPLVLALPYRLAGKAGALVTMALFAACLAWLTLSLAGRYYPDRPGARLLAYAVLMLAPPLVCYAHQVWVEVPAAVLLALALDQVVAQPWRDAPGGARRFLAWLPLTLALVFLPLLKIRFALLAAPVLLLAFRRDGRSRRGLAVLTGLLVAIAAAMLVFNQMRYGNPLKIHRWEELALPAMSFGGTLDGVLGLFWDAAFGLFAFAPIWLLVVPALALTASRRAAAAGHLALVALPYLLLVAPRAEWYGGWAPPFRYGVVFLPLLAVLLVPLLAERHRPGARVVLGVLAGATVVLASIWIAVPGITYHLADGRTRLLDALSFDLSLDVARLFPSYVRPRLASWLWPPISAALVTLGWWLPRRRRGIGSTATYGAIGVCLLLAGTAAIPLAAALLPTRVVEAEDPWLIHHGGHVQPETWVTNRSQYRGGWMVRPGEEIEVPLVRPRGGETARARLTLELRVARNNPDPLALEVLAGGDLADTWRAGRGGVWRRVEVGPVELPAGVPLVLRAAGPPRAGRQNGVFVDRVEVDWQ